MKTKAYQIVFFVGLLREKKTLNPDHSEPATHKISSITIALASASANNIISIAISQKSQP